MASDTFDPEEFLDLKDVTPRTEDHGFTPIVAPPVYTRGNPPPARRPVTLDAEVQRAQPRYDDTPPRAAHAAAPRVPTHPVSPAVARQPAGPVAHHIPGQPHPAAPRPQPAAMAGQAVPHRDPGQYPSQQPAHAPIRHNIPGAPDCAPRPAQPAAPARQPAPAPIRHNIPGAADYAPRAAQTAADQPARAPIRHNIPGADDSGRRPTPFAIPAARPEQPILPPEAPQPARRPVPQDIPLYEAPLPARHRTQGPPQPAPVWPDEDPFADALPQPYVAAPLPARTPVQDHGSDHGGTVIREPMAVGFKGREYRTQSWTVHGFTLQQDLPVEGSVHGRVIDLTLLIGQGVTRIEMRVQARAENDGTDQARRFVFVDLDRAQAEVLHRIVDQVVSNQALTLTQLLNETETDRHAKRATGERVRRFRSAFQLTLAAVVLSLAAGVTWNSFTAVSSRYGAVTVEATSLSVPVPGAITAIAMTPGQAVAQGDVLGYVRPADFDRRQAEMGDRRQQLLDERADLLSRHDTMTQLAAISVSGADTDRARIDQQLSLAQRRLDIERDQLAALRAGGLPTAERQRQRAEQEARVLQAETALLDLRARLDQLSQVAVLAPLGVPGGDLRANTPTLDAVERRIAAVTAELDRIDALGVDGNLGEPIVSPCDCTVMGIERRDGEWATPDQQLAVLVGAEAPTVHALVLSEEARKIAIGDRASIRLADGTRLQGRVQRMNYDPHWRGFAGLQDNVFAADRYARVEILPDQPLTAPVGMVATVTIQTSEFWGWLRATVGV